MRGAAIIRMRTSVPLVGRSETIVLIDGQMDLGEFGYVYFIDFDTTRPRERTVQVQVIGE